MCSDYRIRVELAGVESALAAAGLLAAYPEGRPNIEPRDDVRITDRAPILRAAAATGGAELVQRRWSWPGPGGKPVYNFRSEGREFGSNRCLIVADGFYEFTKPADPKAKRKHKWLFTKKDEPFFCIAGIWRSNPKVGEAFTMLTIAPGADVAPYHDRQICVLDRSDWGRWLDPNVSAFEVLKPLPADTFDVTHVA